MDGSLAERYEPMLETGIGQALAHVRTPDDAVGFVTRYRKATRARESAIEWARDWRGLQGAGRRLTDGSSRTAAGNPSRNALGPGTRLRTSRIPLGLSPVVVSSEETPRGVPK